jgi:hypothetical protein
MSISNIQTPGVYIEELNAFPNSIVPVATAVSTFVGCTPQATYEGKSYLNKALKITSFSDFQAFFMHPDPAPPADPAQQYSPHDYLVEEATQPTTRDYLTIASKYYSIPPDPSTIITSTIASNCSAKPS